MTKRLSIYFLLVVMSFGVFGFADLVGANSHPLTQLPGGGEDPQPSGGGEDPQPSGGGIQTARTSCDKGSCALQNPLQADSIEALFRAIIEIIMVFAIPIIVFFIVYAGFMYVTARGSVEKVQTAHKALLYAIIGALLIIGANVLINVVSGTVSSITR